MNLKIILKYGLLSALCLGLTQSLLGAAIQLQATIDRAQVGLNQIFTITLEATGSDAGSVSLQPEFPASLDQFSKFLGRGGESSNIQLINGRMSVSKSIQLNFMATTVGKHTIEPIKVQAGGETYQTQSFQIEIVDNPNPPASTPGRVNEPIQAEDSIEGNLLLKVIASKRTVYQNEPVIVSYKIYTRVNVSSYSLEKMPSTTGFWLEEFELPQQPRLTNEIIDGRKYAVAEIKKMALFPTEVGKMDIEPLVLACDVRIQSRRRSRDLFDSFFDDPFFSRTQRYQIASPRLSIEVLPLPAENKPRNFSGAVGKFDISATLDKQEVETNESIKLKVKMSGVGNIKILPNPNVKIPDDFEQYGPTSSENISRNENQISGTKTFDYVLIPRSAGEKKIESTEFSFFDISTKTYKTLRTTEFTIKVNKGQKDITHSQGTGFTREEIRILGQDIRYIQQTVPHFAKIGHFYYQTFPFYFLVITPLFLLAGALFYRRRQDKFSEDLGYARARRANKEAGARLNRARKLLSEAHAKEFYAEVSRGLLSFVANKFNLDEAGIMTSQVEKLLTDRKIKPELIKEYLACLQICDYQRFAPIQTSVAEMKKFYDQSRSAMANLQKAL